MTKTVYSSTNPIFAASGGGTIFDKFETLCDRFG